MRIFGFAILISLVVCSCTTDRQAVDKFNHCLGTNELKAYSELELLCDNFIRTNYPKKELNDGYERFLNDLEYYYKKDWEIDTVSVIEMSNKLKDTFGEKYTLEQSYFHRFNPIVNCLKKSNNKRWIDVFIKEHESSGSQGFEMVGGRIKSNKINPTDGLNKIVFVTEVVWRFLYYETVNGQRVAKGQH